MRSLGGISSVSFYSGDQLLGSDYTEPFALDWTPPIEGIYDLTAKAVDTDSNEVISAPVRLYVGNRPPTASLTSPSDFDNFSIGETVTVTASASDVDGFIEKVAFYVDGTLIGEDSTSPYSINWTPQSKAEYVLTARAVDNEGGVSGDSVAVTAGASLTDQNAAGFKDAAVKSHYPDQNNNYTRVEILSRSYTIAGLFGFDLSAIGVSEQVRSATLRLNGNSIGGAMDLSIFGATGDWSETSVTWNNAPSKSSASLDQESISTTGFYSFDVTSHVQAELAGGADILSFWAEDTSRSENTLEINSRTTSTPPELVMTISDVAVLRAGLDAIVPTAPTGLAYSEVTESGATTLTWQVATDNVGVVDYLVYQNSMLIGTVTGLSYSVSALNLSIDNTFYIIARDLVGNLSAASNSVTIAAVVNDTSPPTAPANLTSSNVTQTSLTLSWSDSTDNVGVVSYEVFRSGISIGTSTMTSFDDTGLSATTNYSYTVKAKDAAGNTSPASSPLSVTTPGSSDSDGDGVPDTEDAFPLDPFETVDTDGDGQGNNADLDDDGDGVSDQYEELYGLDPLNPADASLDSDSDGVTNLDEFANQTNPLEDDYAPALTVPEDKLVNSTGPLTTVDIGVATASDGKDGNIVPSLDNSGPFAPGRNTVTWSAEDQAGNLATAQQHIDVIPIANFSATQSVVEGADVTVNVSLNGAAVSYPVVIPYTVSGTSVNPSDHNLN